MTRGREPVLKPRAKVRKGMGLKIVGYAADAILQMLGAKINQELRLRAGSSRLYRTCAGDWL